MAHPLLVPRRFPLALAAAVLLGAAAATPVAGADDLRVVASIKPVHSLVSAVMAGVGEPHLIIRGRSSPHTFTMRPSDATALEDADVIFMIGDTMETALAGSVDALAGHARVVRLADTPGLVLRPLREGGAFEEHDHDSHGHEEQDADHHGEHSDHHDEHADHHDEHTDHHDEHTDHYDEHADHHDEHADHHDEHADHHDEHADHHDEHADHHDEGHADEHDDNEGGPFDMHIWLDPINGRSMAQVIAGTLAEADPVNAATYEANADALRRRLDGVTEEIAQQTASARGVPFLVFHDGYGYFENRFGLTAVGSVVVSPERAPGARRISELRGRMHELGVVCVFDEPQFNKRLVQTILEGSDIKAGTVDPLGAAIEDGPELYVTLLRTMAAAFTACLAPDDGA